MDTLQNGSAGYKGRLNTIHSLDRVRRASSWVTRQENVFFSRPKAGTLNGKPAPRLELTGFLETGRAWPGWARAVGWAMALSGPRDPNIIMTFVTNSCLDRRPEMSRCAGDLGDRALATPDTCCKIWPLS